jgi:hypothetical protein
MTDKAPEIILGFDQAHTLLAEGVIGTKEFRNWLEKRDEFFRAIRDPDVDAEIVRLAALRSEQQEADADILRQRRQDRQHQLVDRSVVPQELVNNHEEES